MRPLDLKLTLTCSLAGVHRSHRRSPMTHASLHGLRVAVTGGTSGLGRALVAELLRRGGRVAFVARHRDEVERTMRDHPGAHGIAGDVSRRDDVHPIAIQITAALGGLDVLVNNASS